MDGVGPRRQENRPEGRYSHRCRGLGKRREDKETIVPEDLRHMKRGPGEGWRRLHEGSLTERGGVLNAEGRSNSRAKTKGRINRRRSGNLRQLH